MRDGDRGKVEGDDPSVGTDRRWVQVAQAYYDPDGPGGLTTTVAYAVAEARGVPPTEVRDPPLYEVVDLPALEAGLFAGGDGVASEPGQVTAPTDARHGTGTVEFRYVDHLVRVRSDGWVQVCEPASPGPGGTDPPGRS